MNSSSITKPSHHYTNRPKQHPYDFATHRYSRRGLHCTVRLYTENLVGNHLQRSHITQHELAKVCTLQSSATELLEAWMKHIERVSGSVWLQDCSQNILTDHRPAEHRYKPNTL